MIKEKLFIFKEKFRHEVSTALITAFGLVTALAWKDVVTEFISRISLTKNLLFTAIVVTLISIIAIALLSKWANSANKEDKK